MVSPSRFSPSLAFSATMLVQIAVAEIRSRQRVFAGTWDGTLAAPL